MLCAGVRGRGGRSLVAGLDGDVVVSIAWSRWENRGETEGVRDCAFVSRVGEDDIEKDGTNMQSR